MEEKKELETIDTSVEFYGSATIKEIAGKDGAVSKHLIVPVKVRSYDAESKDVNAQFFADILISNAKGKHNGITVKNITGKTPTEISELPVLTGEKDENGKDVKTKVALGETKNFIVKGISLKPYKKADGTITSSFIMNDGKTVLKDYLDYNKSAFEIGAMTKAKIENGYVCFDCINRKEKDAEGKPMTVKAKISEKSELGKDLASSLKKNKTLPQTFFSYFKSKEHNGFSKENASLEITADDFVVKTISHLAINEVIKSAYGKEENKEAEKTAVKTTEKPKTMNV